MKIYIDKEFKCHTSDDGTLEAYEYEFFDGKCAAFVEGYRYIPKGCNWTRGDGVVFKGEKAFPWKDFRELDAAQREYERERLEEYESLINELYSEVTSE